LNILVTGASGFVGSHIVEALSAAGHQVRGASRKLPLGVRRKPGIDYRDGVNVSDPASLTTELFSGIEVVVHLIGIIQEGKGDQTFQKIHVDGTKNVLERARASGSVQRFIYMSAIGADVDAPAQYSRTKAAAENLVRESGIPFTIKDGEFVEQMGDLIKHGGLAVNLPFPFIPVPGSGLNKFQPIYIDDLAECVVKSLADPSTIGQIYEVGGATQLTFNELLSKMAGGLKVRKPMLHAPIPILRIVATVMEAIMPKPPVTRDQLKNLGRDNVATGQSVRDTFGVEPIGFDDMVSRIYATS